MNFWLSLMILKGIRLMAFVMLALLMVTGMAWLKQRETRKSKPSKRSGGTQP
jgi:type III secretory pathway component EscV